MSEHTATITVAPSAQGSFSGPFIPTFVLFLGESSRPWWELHSLRECSVPVTSLVPYSPETILRDGLLLIAAQIVNDPAAIKVLGEIGHTPGDGFMDVAQSKTYQEFDDASIRTALASVHLGVTFNRSSSISRDVDWLRTVAPDLAIFHPEEN